MCIRDSHRMGVVKLVVASKTCLRLGTPCNCTWNTPPSFWGATNCGGGRLSTVRLVEASYRNPLDEYLAVMVTGVLLVTIPVLSKPLVMANRVEVHTVLLNATCELSE